MGKSARSARASSCLRSVLTATIAWYVARSSLRVPGSPSRVGGGNGADAGPEARIPAGQAGPGSRLRDGRRPEQQPDHPALAGEEDRLAEGWAPRSGRRVLHAGIPLDLDERGVQPDDGADR